MLMRACDSPSGLWRKYGVRVFSIMNMQPKNYDRYENAG